MLNVDPVALVVCVGVAVVVLTTFLLIFIRRWTGRNDTAGAFIEEFFNGSNAYSVESRYMKDGQFDWRAWLRDHRTEERASKDEPPEE
ncbi:MAG: hypothetical protein R6T99_00940 [Bacteroidales bacterium]